MRILGLLGLVLTLVIVGLLIRQQLTGVSGSVTPAAATAPASVGPADPRAQSQQIQQQFKQSLDAAMQTPRPMPDDN
jgi:hypothetical protein